MSPSANRILLTGGSGRLGTELRKLLSDVVAPPHSDMDVTKPETITAALDRYQPEVVVHAAAYTDVAGGERNHKHCWQVNVEGTRNVVAAVAGRDILMVHISTDYVFDGSRGSYTEDDPPGPVRNYYALTKLVAEESVRLLSRHLVIRTSFRPVMWPYPKAFVDLYTGQDYVDVIAPEIALAIEHCDEVPYNTLHIATERKSAFELARRRRADVVPASKSEAPVALPDDISLDVSRWKALAAKWKKT